MKACMYILAVQLSTLALAETYPMRVWTSTNGSKMEAQYVAARGEWVHLKRQDGHSVKIALKALCATDQVLVKSLRGTSQRTEATGPRGRVPVLGCAEPIEVPGGYSKAYSDDLAPLDVTMHATPAVGDLDGDGKLEILVVGKLSATPLVIRPKTGVWPPRWDKPEPLTAADRKPLRLPGAG